MERMEYARSKKGISDYELRTMVQIDESQVSLSAQPQHVIGRRGEEIVQEDSRAGRQAGELATSIKYILAVNAELGLVGYYVLGDYKEGSTTWQVRCSQCYIIDTCRS